MSVGEWIALGTLALTLLCSIATGCYIAGRHSQKIEASEREIEKLQVRTESHALSVAVIGDMKHLLEEVRGDVKDLLTGRSRSRRNPGDA